MVFVSNPNLASYVDITEQIKIFDTIQCAKQEKENNFKFNFSSAHKIIPYRIQKY